MTLSVEVSLEASAACRSRCPASDRCPGECGSPCRSCCNGRTEVDVVDEDSLCLERTAIDESSKAPEQINGTNLVVAVGICRHGEVLVEEVAIRAVTINKVVVVLCYFRIRVGVGCICIDVAVAVLASVHVDLSMSGVEHRRFVGANSLIPCYL